MPHHLLAQKAAHPRMRGEGSDVLERGGLGAGSSPHARGGRTQDA